MIIINHYDYYKTGVNSPTYYRGTGFDAVEKLGFGLIDRDGHEDLVLAHQLNAFLRNTYGRPSFTTTSASTS